MYSSTNYCIEPTVTIYGRSRGQTLPPATCHYMQLLDFSGLNPDVFKAWWNRKLRVQTMPPITCHYMWLLDLNGLNSYWCVVHPSRLMMVQSLTKKKLFHSSRLKYSRVGVEIDKWLLTKKENKLLHSVRNIYEPFKLFRLPM